VRADDDNTTSDISAAMEYTRSAGLQTSAGNQVSNVPVKGLKQAGLHTIVAALTALAALRAGPASATPTAPASRYASIVIDADTGSVLYERNADLPRYPASLTKIMTLYLAFEALATKKLSLTDELPVSAYAAGRDPSRLDLAPGSRLKVEDAIRAITTKSANDAACIIAEALGGGSEKHFAERMTAKAKALGLTQTTFLNASGLPEDGHLTSARDLALLCKALIQKYPDFYRYFSTDTFEFHGTRFNNQNRFLHTYYGADGIKTGFVNASGHNLAASAVRGGKRLIAVVLGGDTQAWTREHATRLLDVSYAKIDPSLVMVASNAVNAADEAAESAPTVTAAVASPPAPQTPVVQGSQPPPPPAVATTATASPLPLPNATANLTAFVATSTAPGSPGPAASTGTVSDSVPTKPVPAAATKPAQAAAPVPALAEPARSAAAASPPASPNTSTGRAASEKAPPQQKEPTPAATHSAAPPAAIVPASAAPAAATAATPIAAPPKSPQKPAEASVPVAAAPAGSSGGALPVVETVSSSSGAATGGDWSVQVGLFRDATVARRRGEEARQQMPMQLRGADLVVGRAVDGVHVTSRLSRLTEQDARAACNELQRGRVPCVVVPPGRPLIVATN